MYLNISCTFAPVADVKISYKLIVCSSAQVTLRLTLARAGGTLTQKQEPQVREPTLEPRHYLFSIKGIEEPLTTTSACAQVNPDLGCFEYLVTKTNNKN